LRAVSTEATAQQQRPDVVCIMSDDIGWFNIGAYHQGLMSGKTPNRGKIVADGMRFTDDSAEASGIAGLRRHTQSRGEIP
jgi:hypothetical protein